VLVSFGQVYSNTTFTVANNAFTDITNVTSGALALLAGDKVMIFASGDMRVTTANALGGVTPYVNGAAIDANKFGVFGGPSVGLRGNAVHSWQYVVPANGNYTFTLRARWFVNAGVESQTSTGMSWEVFR
jgi:hypothetical protein